MNITTDSAIKTLARQRRSKRKHGPLGGMFNFANPHAKASLRLEGAIAFDHGVGIDRNPYAALSIAGNCWKTGWLAAQRHLLRDFLKTENLGTV